MKKVIGILSLLFILSCCTNKDSKPTELTKLNYSNYVNIVAKVEKDSEYNKIYVSSSPTSSKYRFIGFCYFDVLVKFDYTNKGVGNTSGSSFVFFSITLDEYGYGTGKEDNWGSDYYIFDGKATINIRTVEPSGPDGVVGKVIEV